MQHRTNRFTRRPFLFRFPALREPLRMLGLSLTLMLSEPSQGAESSLRPLGIRLGSSADEVRALASQAGARCSAGTSQVTKALALECRGGFQLEALRQVTFVFSTSERLEGVVLSLPKSRWAAITGVLGERYRIEHKEDPFVGDRRAVFSEGNDRVVVEAPHLGFDMSVLYASADFMRQVLEHLEAESAMRRRQDEQGL